MDNNFVIILGSANKEIIKERIHFAESLLRNKRGFKVIFSGARSEVDYMVKNSSLHGIIENQSATTYDNLLNSKKFMDNAKKVWIITDRTHHLRTRYLANRILREIPFEILSKKMPVPYHFKQLWYESTRFIHNVFH